MMIKISSFIRFYVIFILFIAASASLYAQGTISGTVKDENGNVLSGASVHLIQEL